MNSSPSSSPAPGGASPPPPLPDDLEWEEWDASTSPLSFAHHCLAGSFAGVAEHTLLYPLDTVKTCWQSQVLHRAGGGGAGTAAGCGEPCVVSSAGGMMGERLRGVSPAAVAGEAAEAVLPSKSTTSSGPKANLHLSIPSANSGAQNQGIWSTMKHLMRQGHHHGHPANHQFSHAHVYTLAGNPPNVVDLTSQSSATLNSKDKLKRPWSKRSRALRNATIEDITAHGMIRAAGVSGSSAYNSSAIAAGAVPNRGNNAGVKRLWRGVQTMFVGCIPAHALYFSSYEIIKGYCIADHHQQQQQHDGNHVGNDTLSPVQAMAAGGVATLLHDFIMTPMDTMKQRMQLGHYDNLRHAFASIVWGDPNAKTISAAGGEGWRGLYRSFPITVMTNVPYGMIMMTTNEWLRGVLEDGLYGIHGHDEDRNPFHFATILLSGMGAGAVASFVTAPLDRVKTRLQTQRMGMMLPSGGGAGAGAAANGAGGGGIGGAIMEERALAAALGEPKVCPKMAVRDVGRALGFPSAAAMAQNSSATSSARPAATAMTTTPFRTYYATPLEAFRSIVQEEGPRGLFRGTLPRVALHAPSVAISWTAYETAKDWLVWMQ